MMSGSTRGSATAAPWEAGPIVSCVHGLFLPQRERGEGKGNFEGIDIGRDRPHHLASVFVVLTTVSPQLPPSPLARALREGMGNFLGERVRE